MATTPGGLAYPLITETFDPSGDIEKLARSADVGRIVTVPNEAARAALAAATTIRPLYVHRTDTGALESTTDGTTWRQGVPLEYYTAAGAGGGTLATALAPPSSVATLKLPPGAWLVVASMYFTLSPSAAVTITAAITGLGGSAVGDTSQRGVPAGGTQSFRAEFTRLLISTGESQIHLRGSTSTAGGTQSFGGNSLTAVRIG